MRYKDLFGKWGLTQLKVKTPVAEMVWEPSDFDKEAAWELYVELITRVTTQRLDDQHGTEAAALASIHKLFELTRKSLKNQGRKAEHFTKLAVLVLNQIVRPFTSKWHRLSESNAFENPDQCKEFRAELIALQDSLRSYTKLLADLADVEDLTEIDE